MPGDRLSTSDLEAIREVTEIVVNRDAERLAPLLNDPTAARTFWVWADDYGSHGKLDLASPPGPVSGWEIDAIPFADGSGFAVDVPIWATFGKTDLTLQVRLERRSPDSPPRVVVEDMHVP